MIDVMLLISCHIVVMVLSYDRCCVLALFPGTLSSKTCKVKGHNMAYMPHATNVTIRYQMFEKISMRYPRTNFTMSLVADGKFIAKL